MNNSTQNDRELALLERIEQDPDVTQASLATQLGVAVGTVNWHLKRLIAKGYVKINGHLVAATTSESPRWSLGEVLAHASRSERLYPGEFFGTGTFPGGSGIETGQFLSEGDTVEIGIYGVGSLTNRIIAEKGVENEGHRSVEAN